MSIDRRRFLRILAVLGAAPAASFGRALAAPPDDLVPDGAARVVEIVDGDTVTLADGRAVRLVGIQAPKLALGRAGFADWPLAAEARAVLAALVLDRDVALAFGGRREDRHGRVLAHLFRLGDGLWVQREMLERGFARVYSFADNRAAVAPLLDAERRARAAAAGIWALAFYAVRTPETLTGVRDSFQLVEGRVSGAALVRGRVYLNFGDDWREDFTVAIAAADRPRFEAAWNIEKAADYAALAGRRLRVRGWLRRYNGPLIEASHPEQIEWLD